MDREKVSAADQAKVSVQKKAEEYKANLEAQLKQQRLAAQQVGRPDTRCVPHCNLTT